MLAGTVTFVAALLIFGAMAIAFAVIQDLVLERHAMMRSLRRIRKIEIAPGELRNQQLARPLGERVLLPMLRTVGRFGKRFTPTGVLTRLGKDLVYAGSPAGWDAERVLALKVLSAPGLGVLGLVLTTQLGFAATRAVPVALGMGVLGYYLPEWLVRARAGKRQTQIRRALPDALDLLSITVEAGLGFDAALARVARKADGPLAQELHRVLQEMQIGKSRVEALRSLSERTTVSELASFVLATIQADVFGISIAKVLHVQAREMRIKRRQIAEERAQKVPVKIIFPLLFCIFPALFVVILGPAVITISENLGR